MMLGVHVHHHCDDFFSSSGLYQRHYLRNVRDVLPHCDGETDNIARYTLGTHHHLWLIGALGPIRPQSTSSER